MLLFLLYALLSCMMYTFIISTGPEDVNSRLLSLSFGPSAIFVVLFSSKSPCEGKERRDLLFFLPFYSRERVVWNFKGLENKEGTLVDTYVFHFSSTE